MHTPVFVVSGGYDPIHPGHVETLTIGPNVHVILMSDQWLKRKKGYVVLPWEARRKIIEPYQQVSRVDFSHGPYVDHDLYRIRKLYGPLRTIYFVNGGDRDRARALPKEEQDALHETGIIPIYMNSPKVYSSQTIMEDYYFWREREGPPK